MNDVSIIIINYNSATYTIDCVHSILEQTPLSLQFEIIVVDNASKAEDFSRLKETLSSIENETITLVRSKYNLGFGGGNMYGVQFAKKTRYYAFINNDTILLNDCLSITLDFLQQHPDAAICAPQQYDKDQHVKKSFDHFLTLKRELLGRKVLEALHPTTYPKRQKMYTTPLQVQSVPGSFLVVDATSFEHVGGFDTNIFLYYEETDLCYRIATQLKNGQCFLVPEAKYIHYTGQSTQKSAAIKAELKISLLYVLKKNSGYVAYLILRWWLTFTFLLKSIVKPKYFKFALLFLKGAPISSSLKHQQTIAAS